MGVHIKYNKDRILKPNFKKLKVHTHMDRNVGILKLFPGISEDFVRHVLKMSHLRALVLETFGSGNATTAQWFLDALPAQWRWDVTKPASTWPASVSSADTI